MNFDWNESDQQIIDAFRLARLSHLLPILQETLLHLDLEYTLHIHAFNDDVLTALELLFPEVQERAFIVMGCCDVALWHDDQLIAQQSFDLQSLVHTRNGIDEDFFMSTAIAEAPTLTVTPRIEPPSTPAPPKLPGQTLSAVADIVQQPVELVRAWVQEQDYQIIPFGTEEIVAGDVADATLNHFGSIWLQQQKAKLGLSSPRSAATTAPESNGKATLETPTPAIETETKTSAKADRIKAGRIRSLTLPRSYATKVAKQPKISLERALPQRDQLRAQYLHEMAEQTERGMEFLDKVAAAITKKFGGDKSKLIGNLLQAAKKMQSEVPA